MCLGLAARYEELEQVDRDLSCAERELLAAHLKLAGPQGPRPEPIYVEVLNLRSRLRQLLTRLGEDLAGAP